MGWKAFLAGGAWHHVVVQMDIQTRPLDSLPLWTVLLASRLRSPDLLPRAETPHGGFSLVFSIELDVGICIWCVCVFPVASERMSAREPLELSSKKPAPGRAVRFASNVRDGQIHGQQMYPQWAAQDSQ